MSPKWKNVVKGQARQVAGLARNARTKLTRESSKAPIILISSGILYTYLRNLRTFLELRKSPLMCDYLIVYSPVPFWALSHQSGSAVQSTSGPPMRLSYWVVFWRAERLGAAPKVDWPLAQTALTGRERQGEPVLPCLVMKKDTWCSRCCERFACQPCLSQRKRWTSQM